MGVCVDDIIVGEANGAHVDTAFTYVIVCQESLSRTCIHTPMLSEISLAEVSRHLEAAAASSEEFEYVHFDSRHTEAAIALAKHLNSNYQNDKILSIDIEKSRPHLECLIRYCHIVFTNKKGIREMFPSFCGST
jgi:hypothetical protein